MPRSTPKEHAQPAPRRRTSAASRERELDALLEISRAVSSTLELVPLLDLVLEQAAAVLPYDRSTIMLLEGDELHIRAVRSGAGAPDETLRRQVGIRLPLARTPILWRELRHGQPLIIDDVRDATPLAATYREEVGGFIGPAVTRFRSWLGIPLMLKGEMAGVMTVAGDAVGLYTQRHAELGRAIGAQVAIAVENARLFDQAERRTAELGTLLEVSRNVATAIEVGPLLESVLDQIRTIADYDRGSIQVYENGTFTVRAVRDFGDGLGYRTQMRPGMQFPTPGPAIWAEFEKDEPVIINDINAKTGLGDAYRARLHPDVEPATVPDGSFMALPLVADGEIVGQISIGRDVRDFYTNEHTRLLRAIASQLASAIARARLFEETQARTRQLEALLRADDDLFPARAVDAVLEVLADLAVEVMKADKCVITLVENDEETVRASRNFSEASLARIREQVRERHRDQPLPPPKTFVLHDAANDPRPAVRAIWESEGIESYMAVPFLGQLVGGFGVAYTAPHRFEPDEQRVFESLAARAAVAVQNARLLEETRRQARETEALLRADSELFHTLSLDAVLQSLVDVAVDVLGVDKSLVTLWDRERNTAAVRAARNFSAEGLDLFRQLLPAAGLGSLRDDVEPTVHPGLGAAGMPPAVRAIMEVEGVHAAMDVPIRSALGEVLGGYGVAYTTAHAFDADERRLLTALADRAAVAIQNAKLLHETQRQAKVTEALLRADAELFQSLSLDAVLQALVDVAVDILGVDKSSVTLHMGDIDVIRAARNHAPENVAILNESLAKMPHEEPPPAGQTPRVYTDARHAPDFIADALAREGIVSHVNVPIRDPRRMLGVFGVSFVETHEFTDDEQSVYLALADRAAVAIQNAELYERAQHAASLEERQRLARELHDSVSQALYGIALGARTARIRIDADAASAAEPIEYVMSLAQAGLAEMRALIFELRPESLENEGIVAAIEKQVASTEARHQIAIEMKLPEEPDCALEVKEALYRIVQEALHNVVKHAQAENVTVRLAHDRAGLILTVTDDGRGFDATASFPGHIGLLSMPERAAKLGGSVTIESELGRGTSVVARVPLRAESPPEPVPIPGA